MTKDFIVSEYFYEDCFMLSKITHWRFKILTHQRPICWSTFLIQVQYRLSVSVRLLGKQWYLYYWKSYLFETKSVKLPQVTKNGIEWIDLFTARMCKQKHNSVTSLLKCCRAKRTHIFAKSFYVIKYFFDWELSLTKIEPKFRKKLSQKMKLSKILVIR